MSAPMYYVVESPLAEDCGEGWEWGNDGRRQIGNIRISPLRSARVYSTDAGALIVDEGVGAALHAKFGAGVQLRAALPSGFFQVMPTAFVTAATELDEEDGAVVLVDPLLITLPPAGAVFFSMHENPNHILISQEAFDFLRELEPLVDGEAVGIQASSPVQG